MTATPELTSVSSVQTYLNDTTITSAALTTIILAAEAAIARACGRYDEANAATSAHWISASRVERLDGECFQHLLLRWTPITAIASITITNTSSQSDTLTLTDLECDGIAIASLSTSVSGYQGRVGWRSSPTASVAAWFDSGYARPNPSPMSWGWPNFRGGRMRVVATYTGGYATVPSDLGFAATMLAAEMYRNQSIDPDIVSRTLGQYSETRRAGTAVQDNGLGQLAGMLAPYRRYVA